MSRVKINSLYLYQKDQAQSNAIEFLEEQKRLREGKTKAEIEDLSVMHRRIYLAGLYMEMLSPELSKLLASTLDKDRATEEHLQHAIQFLGLNNMATSKPADVECDTVTEVDEDVEVVVEPEPVPEPEVVETPKPVVEDKPAVTHNVTQAASNATRLFGNKK